MDSNNPGHSADCGASSASIFELFQLLSNPLRLRILMLLIEQPRDVTELTDAVRRQMSAVSENLRLLSGAGLVERDRHGQHRVYHVCTPVTVTRVGNELQLRFVSADGCAVFFTVHDGVFHPSLRGKGGRQTGGTEDIPGRDYEVRTSREATDDMLGNKRPKAARIIKPRPSPNDP